MTGNHRTPDRRSDPNRPGQSARKAMNQGGIPPLRLPENPLQPVKRPIEPSGEPPNAAYSGVSAAVPQVARSTETSQERVAVLPSEASPPATAVRRRTLKLPPLRFLRRWQFWGVILVLATSGIGITSAILLLKLPALPNCPAIFWPTASASLRLYCAQMMADKRTVNDLLKAISLVNGLPPDHPLRPEINREIEEWSKEILALGEEAFQQGKLKDAIDTAQQIPANTAVYKSVNKQVQSWNKLWQKAAGIYQDAENALRRQDLKQAFVIGTRLLGVGNHYWETTKYQELNNLIAATREDGANLDKAKGLAKQGGLSNMLAAIKLVNGIKPNSYLYQKAQQTIADFGQTMMDLADAALEQHDYNQAMSIVHQIPDQAKLQEDIKDFSALAEARAQAWGGTTDDLTSAIMQAQKLQSDRPLYGKAQQLVSNWQLEIQDVKHLERARQIAQPGSMADLTAAIAEAQQVPPGNPRATEAQKAIDEWTASIQTTEDQPYLDRAEQLASKGDLNALQAAINQASRIQPGRALYDKADQRIQSWTDQVQRIQDQPYLDRAKQLADQGDLVGAIDAAGQVGPGRALSKDAQALIRDWKNQVEQLQDQPYLARARQLADQGNFGEAIATAGHIGTGRALYDQAQTEIRGWQHQTNGQDQMQQAYDAANAGTSTMLKSAIQMADQVPADSPTRPEADRMIDRWSQQILTIARSRSASSLQDAIAIAQSIPANTSAYADAQQLIQTWQRSLGH